MGAQKTGEGQYVDTSMLDPGAVSWLPILASDYFVTGEPPKAGSAMLIGRNACYEVYETADGSSSPSPQWNRTSGPTSVTS